MTDHDASAATSGVAVLHIWRVSTRGIPAAWRRMATQRATVRALPFGKLLGTGSGDTYAARDANLHRYALLTYWETACAAANFERSSIVRSWGSVATERCRIRLQPCASRGTWSGRAPFGEPAPGQVHPSGPVAAITYARIRARRIPTFWRAVPSVSQDLSQRHGSLFRLAIGTAPVGVQGTFSVWSSEENLRAFAYAPKHREVIERRASERWYAEELFARFIVLSVEGTVDNIAPFDLSRP